MRKTTDKERLEIVERYKNGEGSYVLGKEYGVSPNAILSLLRTRGVEIRKATHDKK